MNIKKILCPIDFSDFNTAANEFASLFAKTVGAEIVYLHIAEQGAYNGDYDYAMQRTAERKLRKLITIKPSFADIKFSHEVKVCSLFADTIVEYALEHDVDLIVLATHGRTGLRRLLLGSVAESVVRKAHCAVSTIRPESSFFKNQSALDWTAESVSPQSEESVS